MAKSRSVGATAQQCEFPTRVEMTLQRSMFVCVQVHISLLFTVLWHWRDIITTKNHYEDWKFWMHCLLSSSHDAGADEHTFVNKGRCEWFVGGSRRRVVKDTTRTLQSILERLSNESDFSVGSTRSARQLVNLNIVTGACVFTSSLLVLPRQLARCLILFFAETVN